MRRDYRDSDKVITDGIMADVRKYIRKELEQEEERLVKIISKAITKACEEARLANEKAPPISEWVREEDRGLPEV